MKKTTLLYALFISVGSMLALQSFSSGPAGANRDQTNSPFSSNNCSQCHSDNNNFNAVSTVQVTDANGASVTEYMPGNVYTVTYTVGATGASAYGMQMVALNASNANAGTLANPSNNAKITALNGRNYFEHNSRSSSNSFTVEWTAPAAGAGTVTLYGSGMAINTDGGTSGDDPTASITASLTEGNATSVRTIGEDAGQLSIFPIPNNGIFSIENNQIEAVEYIRILTLTGVEVSQQQVYLPVGGAQKLRFEDLTPGVYQVVTEGKTLRQARTIIVQ